MMLRDWRAADAATVRACYDREQAHWRDALSWDTAWTWETIEQARTASGLPGFLAVDATGRVRGWTFFVVEDGRLDIGGLVADDEAATAALVDGAMVTAEEIGTEQVACFILDRAPGLATAFRERGFDIERFDYLSLPLADRPQPKPGLPPDAWRQDDLPAADDLLAAAYTPEAARHFAPDGDWRRYVSGLISQAGCGTFDPALTRVVRGATQLDGLIVVTRLGPATAHVAQVAVHPERRGRGMARALVATAAAAAAAAGNIEMTLLVGERNTPARRLYSSMGFVPRASFVAATGAAWPAVWRSSASA
jgi:ribosomal protein S18 acetylase RimI-like enzyme